MVERLGAVQIDSVNVIARSHYLVGWSRLGAYEPALLDRLAYEAPRVAFEYWGHEASLLPVDLQPLLRWRMEAARHDAWGRIRAMGRRKAFVGKVLAAIEDRGPIGAGDLDVPMKPRGPKAKSGWWGWSDAKVAVEWLFWSGAVTTAARRSFERLYDLPARVLPPEVLAVTTPSVADAQRALVARGARALGIGTERDLRDYYRLKPDAARPAIAALVEDGTLRRVTVAGWSKPAYVHRDADTAPAVDAVADGARAALLSPFDSLVWARERTEHLFGMVFRLEIYTPEEKRVHGYYVLPFLLGDQLVARVDVKADRAAGTLRVHAAHLEPGQPARVVARALAAELRGLASWLGLPAVAIAKKGNLATELARAIRPAPRTARRT
ncbi:MAG: YcaQ family DNA glycosylase [Deltaproteobacteria bacterium]|nr:YcaQ family DNA glycosylase [Deltaproteobacteria bacterium]MCW5806819.1 YcaQ family DNA glycosylase [Deltaproteobacteria bacterium]